MPKRKILPAGELPAWNFTKRPKLEQVESPLDETVAATADTAKSSIGRTDGKQRPKELVRARAGKYQRHIRSQSSSSLNNEKVIKSIGIEPVDP